MAKVGNVYICKAIVAKALMLQPLKIFIIYARKDIEFRDELIYHLKPLKILGLVDTWHDGDLQPGAEWDVEIKSQLRHADIIIPLISAHFINSEYILGVEFKEARQRWEHGEVEITPIIVRDCLWSALDNLSDLQALPSNGQIILPVIRWADRDEAWTVIANDLRWLCTEVLKRRHYNDNTPLKQNASINSIIKEHRPYTSRQDRLLEQPIQFNSRKEAQAYNDLIKVEEALRQNFTKNDAARMLGYPGSDNLRSRIKICYQNFPHLFQSFPMVRKAYYTIVKE